MRGGLLVLMDSHCQRGESCPVYRVHSSCATRIYTSSLISPHAFSRYMCPSPLCRGALHGRTWASACCHGGLWETCCPLGLTCSGSFWISTLGRTFRENTGTNRKLASNVTGCALNYPFLSLGHLLFQLSLGTVYTYYFRAFAGPFERE